MNLSKLSPIADDSDDLTIQHSGTGQLVTLISTIKKIHGKGKPINRFLQRQREEDKKGFVNEKLFLGMAKEVIKNGLFPEILKIRKASRNQDERHGIDFWIDIVIDDTAQHSIPLQIKSSWFGRHKFQDKYGEKAEGIHIVVMDEEMNERLLALELRSIISKELKRLQKEKTKRNLN
ncbi:MAG: hypothetical protein AAB470_00330 [Patescibacteria group bacterium]